MTFFGSVKYNKSKPPRGTEVVVEGLDRPAIVHKNGMVLFGTDGRMVRKLYWFCFNLCFVMLQFMGKCFHHIIIM